MDLPLLLAGLVRGLGLLSLTAVIGGLVLECLILPKGAPPFEPARIRLRRLITGGLVVLVLTTLADLVLRAQVMSRAPLAVAIVAVPDVMARTHFGAILAARAVMLALAVLLSLARATALRVLCLLIALAVALTTTLTGHASGWGDLTVSVAVDWIHAVAASAWVGGLLALAVVIFRSEPHWPPASLAILAPRFSRLAGACLLVVVLTGSYNAWAQLGALSRLWTTTYGGVLIVKLLLVVVLIGLGAVNRYVALPGLGPQRARGVGARLFRLSRLVALGPRRGARPAMAASRLAAYVRGEAIIALAVFACTAALGEITPGRHVSFERRGTSHVSPVQRRQTSFVGRGSVTPPSGDAARGRAVFVKLKCFTCHTVQGEAFPAPSRPGPDLTDAGSRLPGYLVESIMNPNAMIVDGPGYTDDRGLSIMPDYRDNLTVGELIDLVAYLKTLQAKPDAAGAGS
jgi:putative copper export protein/mono/diheme cytochrome c family protein